MLNSQKMDEKNPLDAQGDQYSPLDDPDVLPSILRFMDRESILSMQRTQKKWGGVMQPSGILPPCVDKRVWENMKEQPCTLDRRWDFDPETIMRATLCAFDLVQKQPFQNITHPIMHPIHMYVRDGQIDEFNNNEVVKCMVTNGYELEVTLLYPPNERIPEQLPQVAGLTPKGSLVVVDVPMDGLPKEALVKAQTIRFEGERTTIYGNEFRNMTNLKELPPRMPHLISIGEEAFVECTGLTALGDMKSLHTIGDWAFKSCFGLHTLGDMKSLHTIRDGAFYGCTGLTALGDMNALTTIGDQAFITTGLHTLGDMNALETIGWGAFIGCDKLETVGRMDALHTIGDGAFFGCTGLRALGDMTSLHTIEPKAFFGCTKLDKFHIPETMNSVMKNAFKDCPLGELTVASANFQFQCYDDTLLKRLLEFPIPKQPFGTLHRRELGVPMKYVPLVEISGNTVSIMPVVHTKRPTRA